MIIEHATLRITEGAEREFEAAVAKAVEVFRAANGCLGLQLQKAIEEPLTYILAIRWQTLEAHTVDFRESDLFGQWRALVSPYFAEPPSVLHYEIKLPAVAF